MRFSANNREYAPRKETRLAYICGYAGFHYVTSMCLLRVRPTLHALLPTISLPTISPSQKWPPQTKIDYFLYLFEHVLLSLFLWVSSWCADRWNWLCGLNFLISRLKKNIAVCSAQEYIHRKQAFQEEYKETTLCFQSCITTEGTTMSLCPW